MRRMKASRCLTDKKILHLCKQQLGYEDCTLVPGPPTEVVCKTVPPANTVAVVVDISPNGGAMKVGEHADNELGVKAVGKVGTEDAVDLAVVPWRDGWWFYSIGSVALRYIVRA